MVIRRVRRRGQSVDLLSSSRVHWAGMSLERGFTANGDITDKTWHLLGQWRLRYPEVEPGRTTLLPVSVSLIETGQIYPNVLGQRNPRQLTTFHKSVNLPLNAYICTTDRGMLIVQGKSLLDHRPSIKYY